MPAIKLVTSQDIGSGLEQANGKLQVKIDGTSIKLNTDGALSATQLVDVKISGVELLPSNDLQFTLSDGTVITESLQNLINVDTNTYPTEAKFSSGGLKLTMNDGTFLSASLEPFDPTIRSISGEVVESYRGDEAQDLAGNTLGYFMTTPTTP